MEIFIAVFIVAPVALVGWTFACVMEAFTQPTKGELK